MLGQECSKTSKTVSKNTAASRVWFPLAKVRTIQASKVIRVIMSFTDYNTLNFLNDVTEDFYFWEDGVDIFPGPSTKYNKAPGHPT